MSMTLSRQRSRSCDGIPHLPLDGAWLGSKEFGGYSHDDVFELISIIKHTGGMLAVCGAVLGGRILCADLS